MFIHLTQLLITPSSGLIRDGDESPRCLAEASLPRMLQSLVVQTEGRAMTGSSSSSEARSRRSESSSNQDGSETIVDHHSMPQQIFQERINRRGCHRDEI